MRKFEEDLASVFGEKMRSDEKFCEQIWSALANKKWQHESGEKYACTFRYAGGLIAEIIDRGDYLDWYCCGPYAMVSEEIEGGMAELGWTHHDYDD